MSDDVRSASTRSERRVAPQGLLAPALLAAGAAGFVAFGVAAGETARSTAARDARSALSARVESELAVAAQRLREIVASTRDRGVFKDVPFPFDTRAVAWTPAPPAADDPAFAAAERLEFETRDDAAALAAIRRAAEGTPVSARALRDEARILRRMGQGDAADDALRRAAAAEGVSDRDALFARYDLARAGDDAERRSLRDDLAAGSFAAVAARERIVVLRGLGGEPADIVALAAFVAIEDAADRDAAVVVDAAHVAWRLERSGSNVRVAVAPLAPFAAGLVPAAAEGLVAALPSAEPVRFAPFPSLRFEPTERARALFDERAARAARSIWLPACAIAAAFAAGAVVTFLHARARAALESRKDAFLCAVTHELKTPIANVLLYAETLKEHGAADPAQIPRFAGTIASEALRLEARVAEILDVASGRADVPRGDERFDAAAAARDVAAEFAERAAGRGIDFETDLGAGPAFVRGSSRMLRRALAAVIDNALAFAPGGTVRVSVAHAPGRLTVVVEDDGPGVPAAQRERVFEPFVRLGDERTREVPGTGLGLTLARQGVESCGGTIRCEGRDGPGARIVFSIPEG